MPSPPRTRRTGFSLVEAVVALSITVTAGAALLHATFAALYAADRGLEQAIAHHLADSLLDEIAGCRYTAQGASPYQWPLGPNSWEKAGAGRERFDDIDDFHQWKSSPATSVWGQELGTGGSSGNPRHPNFTAPLRYFRDWRQTIDVYYTDNNNPSLRLPAGATSNHRAVTVTIWVREDGRWRTLAERTRVFAYVASS